jgi:hypothetical protein
MVVLPSPTSDDPSFPKVPPELLPLPPPELLDPLGPPSFVENPLESLLLPHATAITAARRIEPDAKRSVPCRMTRQG